MQPAHAPSRSQKDQHAKQCPLRADALRKPGGKRREEAEADDGKRSQQAGAGRRQAELRADLGQQCRGAGEDRPKIEGDENEADAENEPARQRFGEQGAAAGGMLSASASISGSSASLSWREGSILGKCNSRRKGSTPNSQLPLRTRAPRTPHLLTAPPDRTFGPHLLTAPSARTLLPHPRPHPLDRTSLPHPPTAPTEVEFHKPSYPNTSAVSGSATGTRRARRDRNQQRRPSQQSPTRSAQI